MKFEILLSLQEASVYLFLPPLISVTGGGIWNPVHTFYVYIKTNNDAPSAGCITRDCWKKNNWRKEIWDDDVLSQRVVKEEIEVLEYSSAGG